MNTHKVTFAALAVTMAVALVFAIAPAFVTSASAKIECVNPGGQNPQGNCQGANERQNPAGHAPPGQNP
ncbi:MAG: hypothetical protein M3247_06665 [Thermoproteota archaeon]|nr:hypothetical protein [Thermoproteota archaeon]